VMPIATFDNRYTVHVGGKRMKRLTTNTLISVGSTLNCGVTSEGLSSPLSEAYAHEHLHTLCLMTTAMQVTLPAAQIVHNCTLKCLHFRKNANYFH